MKIYGINSNITYTPNFKSTNRMFFKDSAKKAFCQGEISNYTYPFRKDIEDWFELGKYILNNFKNKDTVKIYSLACSDGSEAYTLAIVLNSLKSDKRVFPIIAVDKDENIIEHAKKGRINLTCEDIIRIRKFTGDNQTYFTDIKDEAIIKDKYNEVINDWDYSYPKFFSYKVDENLRKAVDFKTGDLINTVQKIKDDSNTFVACRNVMPYLKDSEQKKLINLLKINLKSGSLLAIGHYDDRVYTNKLLIKNGFYPAEIKYLYKKSDL